MCTIAHTEELVYSWELIMNTPTPGIYYHFKDPSKHYEVLGTAYHTETEELMVLYKPLYEFPYEYCVRPVAMFMEDVDKPELGYRGPRFVRIGDA